MEQVIERGGQGLGNRADRFAAAVGQMDDRAPPVLFVDAARGEPRLKLRVRGGVQAPPEALGLTTPM